MSDTPITEPDQVEGSDLIEIPEQDAVTNLESDPAQDAEQKSEGTEEEVTLYVEIDGEEYPLDEVKDWRKSGLRQSDYTKKATAIAEERKAIEAEKSSLSQMKSALKDMHDQLKVLISEDEQINWKELREQDPDRYIELRERADKRKAALEQVKAEQVEDVDVNAERKALFDANPDWLADGKTTEAYAADTKLIQEYANKAGFTASEFAKLSRARYMIAILKAAKYDQLQEKAKQVSAERKRVPVVAKPKANVTQAKPTTLAEALYGKAS